MHREVRQTNPVFSSLTLGLHHWKHPHCSPLNMYTVATVFKQKVLNIHLKLKEFFIHYVLAQADKISQITQK